MPLHRWQRAIVNPVIHVTVSALLGVLRILPQRVAFALVPPLTTLVWWFNPGWRRTSMRNMEIFFMGQPLGAPESRRERYQLGLRAAIQFGYHCFEFGRMGFLPVEKTLAMVEEVEGLEHMQNALALGHGVIGLGVHYSNWELPGIYLAQKVAPVYGLGKEQKDPFFTNLLFPRRERYGMRNIAANNKMTSGILRALQEGAIFGILADQNGGSTGVFAPFAGTLASTGPGPAALALKTGAPIIPTFTRRIKPGRVKLYFKPPIDTSNLPAEKQAAILELLTRVNATYETVIREDPTLWLWGHKRWKTRPPGEPPLY